MAIHDFGGRLRSVRSPEETALKIKQEFDSLSPEEQEAVQLCLAELNDPAFQHLAGQGEAPPRIYDVLKESEFIREPVDIETFVKDEYYLGKTCDVLYPKLLDDLKEVFTGGYKEVIATGSIGYGKTFAASIAVCRCLYELSCLRDPHKTFGLGSGTNIAFAALSVNESLAIKVVFENIANKIEQSPYFQEHFPFQATKKEIRFPGNIWLAARATTDNAVLGLNVFGAILDEGNFFAPMKRGQAGAEARWGGGDRAQHIYDQLTRRMKSRFQRHGKLPGLMIIVSSKRTRDDFTAKRIRESKDDPDIYVMDYAIWDVKDVFSEERFPVLAGNELIPSRILAREEVEEVKAKMPDGIIIVEVPTDFRQDFENDIEGALRDIAGVETVSISPFIQQREKLVECVDKSRQHPFEFVTWDQSGGGGFVWSRLARQEQMRDGAELLTAWRPIHYPEAARHIHIDPSNNSDCTGIAMGCVAGYTAVTRRDPSSMEQFTEMAPVIWVDFMLRIVPPIGGEIDHGGVRGLVYQLRSHGFMISLVTTDQFNSAPTLQKLATKGFTVERLSVDRPMDAYDTLKTGIYERRVLIYEYEPVLEELRTIQKDNVKNKVDHPKNGKKDVADALAGITYSLTTNYHGPPMGIFKGISNYSDPIANEQKDMVSEESFMLPFLTG